MILVNKPNTALDALLLRVVTNIPLKESILEIKCYEKRCSRPDIIVRHIYQCIQYDIYLSTDE